jgi:AraC-like DNA-binding protein
MDYIFNAEKIKKLLLDFYLSTDIAVTFYDSSMNMVATSPVHSDYCEYVRRSPDRKIHCNLSNVEHMREAAKKKVTVSYTCHAALMETIIPVLYEETLIGFMQIGQFRDKMQKYSSEEKLLSAAKVYNLEEKTCLSLYQKLPIVSDEKFEALKKILLILIKSFWDDSLIRHNRSMLSVKIEQFVSEHLKEKIYVDTLCKQFFISKNALYRLFNSEFGMTVNDYVLNKRIQFSIDLLKETSLPITRVAADCGFTDYNYFIRAFKKQVGVTPLQFRKNK